MLLSKYLFLGALILLTGCQTSKAFTHASHQFADSVGSETVEYSGFDAEIKARVETFRSLDPVRYSDGVVFHNWISPIYMNYVIEDSDLTDFQKQIRLQVLERYGIAANGETE